MVDLIHTRTTLYTEILAMFIPTRMKPAPELQEILGGAFYNTFKYLKSWLYESVGMEKYDEKSYLGNIYTWMLLGGGIWAVLSFLMKTYTDWDIRVIAPVCGLATITLLVVLKYISKSKEADHYKNQLIACENSKLRGKK